MTLRPFILERTTRHKAWGRFAPPPFVSFWAALGQGRAARGECAS